MIAVVTDNLDEHTIFVSYSFYSGEGLFDKKKIHFGGERTAYRKNESYE